MQSFEVAKEKLLSLSEDLLESIDAARSIPGISTKPLDGWEQILRGMDERIHGDVIRIAVVGAIKSGKSTFVNAILGRDYLKRGAGVITSMITRVRKNSKLEAILDLKNWEEVNAEMQQAMVLFPSLERQHGSQPFDIRQKSDRAELEKVLNTLIGEKIITNETLDSKSVLLSSYLKGYPKIKEMVSRESGVFTFVGPVQIGKHREFAGDDALAVYLKDLELHVPAEGILDENTEIGDCQGVDSINPHHLAMIQDYLLNTHLILYVVSSRTGIRQADVGFLSLIKKMGFMDNVFFVVNCDFNEHGDMSDLKRVTDRVAEELSMIKPDPEIFVFSALLNLFENTESDLSEKDREKLRQWKVDEELKAFSDCETERFNTFLENRLNRDRVNLLLKSHTERLNAAATNLRQWAAFNRELLLKGTQEARQVLDTTRHTLEQLEGQKNLLKDTLDGSSLKIKRSLGADIDGMLDARFGALVKDIRDFVKRYDVDYHIIEQDIEEKGFSSVLYDLFQKFKEALDRYITETINPQLIQFIHQEEKKAEEKLHAIAKSYELLIREAQYRHQSVLTTMGVGVTENRESTPSEISGWELGGLKRKNGVRMPSFVSTLHYSAKIRSEAIMRLGVYKLVGVVRGLLRKRKDKERAGEIFALRDGMGRIKKETMRSLVFHINDYRENLKFQYFYILTDAIAQNIYETVIDRFRIFTVDMSEATDLIDGDQLEKDRVIEMLHGIETGGEGILDRLREIKKSIAS